MLKSSLPRTLLTSALLLGLAACTSAPPASEAPAVTVSQRFLDEPTRRVVQLSNGFTLILQQNKTAPVVATRIYVKAGSLTEQEFMGAGISHVVEHLVAGADSAKRKEDQNTLLLQQIGNDSNAQTTYDTTCYFITTTADKWPVALDLLADWTTHADFTKEQFEREYKVVQRELEMDEAEADATFYNFAASNRYLVHPARHPIIGYKPAFQKLTFEDAKTYYHRMYVPDNMVISIAGDFDLDQAEKLASEKLASVPRQVVPSISLPAEPQVLAPRHAVARADVRQARVMWAFPTMSLYNPELYATDVLAGILGGGDSSLLVSSLRDSQNLVTDISCINDTPPYVIGSLEVAAALDPENILPAQKAVLQALAQVAKNGVTPAQLKRAQAQISAQRVYGDQTPEQQAVRNVLDYINTGNIDFTETYTRRIEAVTPADVQAAARKYLRPDRLLITALLPLKAPDPFNESLAVAATAPSQTATTKTTLNNGLTLLITPNHSSPIVTFHLYTLGGLLAESASDNGVGNAMMSLMTRSTTSRSHQQIVDFLDSTATTLSSESGSNSFALTCQCLKEHAPDAFDLFADIALHPAFSPEELEHLRPLLLALEMRSSEDWFEEAYKFAKEDYYANSPYQRQPSGTPAVIEKLTAEQIRRHYLQYFLDPQKTVLAISGDLDPKTAAAWAAQFASIPQSSPSLSPPSTARPAHTAIHHTNKESATIIFAYPPGSTAASPDHDALLLLQTYLGGYSSPGGSVLHETLRGQGLVYTVQAASISGAVPGMFMISALGEPQNSDQIIALVNQIVADTKAGKFSDQALEAAKDQAITGEKLSKQTIADKASARALDELMGLGYDADTRFADHIRKLTREDLLRVANQYLQSPTIIITTPAARETPAK